jgi:hypothetical protein
MIHVLLVAADPLLRELITDLAEQAELPLAAAVASLGEARAVLRADDRALAAPLVVVVAARRACGRTAADGEPDERAPGAEGRWLPHAADDEGPAAQPGPAGVVYFGEHVSALRAQGVGPHAWFLDVPFGHAALAAAVYGLAGQPVPRWLEPRRRDVRERLPEAGRSPPT